MTDTVWNTTEDTYNDHKDEAWTGFNLSTWVRDEGNYSYDLSSYVTDLNVSGGERDIEQIVTFGGNKCARRQIMEPISVEMTLLNANHLPWSFLSGTADGSSEGPDTSPPYVAMLGNDALERLYDIQLLYSFHSNEFVDTVASRVDIGRKMCIYLTDTYVISTPLAQSMDEPGEITLTFKAIPTGTNCTVEYTPDSGVNALTTDILPVA